eukprot:4227384-Heterocapsa_arctica.AAC.1
MVGPYVDKVFRRAAEFCRIGLLANSFRAALARLVVGGVPPSAWAIPDSWTAVLDGLAALSPPVCAVASARALEQARVDWTTECAMFRRAPGGPVLEDWTASAWADPLLPAADPRSRYLDAVRASLPGESDVGLFGDGGFTPRDGATFAAQARAFGPLGRYWD